MEEIKQVKFLIFNFEDEELYLNIIDDKIWKTAKLNKMKHLHFWIIWFFFIPPVIYGQQENTSKKDTTPCKRTFVSAIQVDYTYQIDHPNSVVPRKMSYPVSLVIAKNVAQYVHNRPKKVFRKDNFQVTVNPLFYVNNYYYRADSMVEYRLKDGLYLKARWKPDYHWKITNETKTIQGYTVRKAIGESIEIPPDDPGYYGKVYAWFTDEIPIPAGPERYVGLPGLILEIEYDKDPGRKIKLQKITFNPPETKWVRIDPKKVVEVPDKWDVIYYWHKNPRLVRKLIRRAKRRMKQ